MSQTMNQKPASKKKKKSKLPLVDEMEVDELTGAEKMFQTVKPHLSTIGLVIVAGLLGFVAIALLMRSQFDKQAIEWRELTNASAIAMRTGDISALTGVSNSYPETRAGLWALQLAGDQQLRMGIEQLGTDRVAGNQLIEKSRESFLSIVNAPQTAKSTMLDRRSHFSLAYAYESLGQMDKAKKVYDELITQAPDSAFADAAKRGLKRSSNEQYAALYEKFTNFEESVIGTAPGPSIPDRPDITFPTNDLSPGVKPPVQDEVEKENNDFVPTTTTETDSSESKPEAETKTEEPETNPKTDDN